jgi:serine/threonine protein phosphatase PrpC
MMANAERDESLRRDPAIRWGVATLSMPGEQECGDAYVVQPYDGGLIVGVVDGLGHGHEAALVARRATETLARHAGRDLIALIGQVHSELYQTRGVVLSVAAIEAGDGRGAGQMHWLSVGNVDGLLLRAQPGLGRRRELLVARGGVVGYRLPALQESHVTLAPGDCLIFATDGIASNFAENLTLSAEPQALADRILERYRKLTDDALVLVARVAGETGGETP